MSASDSETNRQSEASVTPETRVDWTGLKIDVFPKWSGGCADVYVASHPTLGTLALKRLKGPCIQGSKEYRQLHREVKIWRDLVHPNILKFIGTYEVQEIVYIVSPLLKNGTVPHYLAANPDVDRVPFIRDLAKGLNYLHQQGVVHGDIKGNNFLVSSSVPVEGVVADFGLAKLVDTQTVTSLRNAGTPRWQSPEMMMEGAPKTFKSDVYAFGMTVYEIISGRIPFEGSPTYAIYAKIFKGERPSLEPRVSRSGYVYNQEWTIAQAAWDHDPDRRPTMEGVTKLLESQFHPRRAMGVTETQINQTATASPKQRASRSRSKHQDHSSDSTSYSTSVGDRPLGQPHSDSEDDEPARDGLQVALARLQLQMPEEDMYNWTLPRPAPPMHKFPQHDNCIPHVTSREFNLCARGVPSDMMFRYKMGYDSARGISLQVERQLQGKHQLPIPSAGLESEPLMAFSTPCTVWVGWNLLGIDDVDWDGSAYVGEMLRDMSDRPWRWMVVPMLGGGVAMYRLVRKMGPEDVDYWSDLDVS